MYNSDELYHFGVKGMKWGIRRYRNKVKSKRMAKLHQQEVERRAKLHQLEVERINDAARKSGRLWDDGNPNVVGVRQKNGDILFVDRKEVNKNGIDVAERKVLDETERIRRANKIKKGKEKVNKILESEEKKLVKDMIKTYDMSDPDSEEALAILREIEKDF